MRPEHEQIEAHLAPIEPDVEVIAVELIGGKTVRVFIDHPDGVTLGVCERVSGHLSELRREHALEVSSPGARRPLTKPEHFRRFLGCRARVRTRGPVCEERHDQSSFTGELVEATNREVTVAAAEGTVTIPYADIQRSNLVED